MSCSLGAGVLLPARVCQQGWHPGAGDGFSSCGLGCVRVAGLGTQMGRRENRERDFVLGGFFFWQPEGLWWLCSSSGSKGYFLVLLLSLLGLLDRVFFTLCAPQEPPPEWQRQLEVPCWRWEFLALGFQAGSGSCGLILHRFRQLWELLIPVFLKKKFFVTSKFCHFFTTWSQDRPGAVGPFQKKGKEDKSLSFPASPPSHCCRESCVFPLCNPGY